MRRMLVPISKRQDFSRMPKMFNAENISPGLGRKPRAEGGIEVKIFYCRRFDLDFYWNEWVSFKKRSIAWMAIYEFGPLMLTIHGANR